MSSLKTSLLAALTAVLITVGGLSLFNHRRAKEAASLRDANSRMRFQINQHYRATSSAVSPVAAARTESGSSSMEKEVPVTAPVSTENYRNQGQATPLATLQTFAWACDRGDVATVRALLTFDAAARTKTEALLAALPESARQQWNSPEDMAAALLTSQAINYPFPSTAILQKAGIESIGADRVRVRLPDTPKDRTEYQKTGDVWKYVVTEAAVDAYIKASAAARRGVELAPQIPEQPPQNGAK